MKKKHIVIAASAAVLLIAGGVVLSNRLIGGTVPHFTYSDPAADDSSMTDTADSSAETSFIATGAASDVDDTSSVGEFTPDNMVMLCGDPQHSIYAEYDGNTLTVSGTCAEDADISASISSDASLLPEITRNGSEYSLVFELGKTDGTIPVELFFGSGSLVYTYDLYTDGSRIVEGEFSAISEINAKSLENASELTAEYTMEYVLPGGTAEERADILAQIRELSDKICEGITDDYDKARALSEWISANIYYDYDARHDSVDMETVSLAHILELHRSVCIGYANLYSALCSAQGITCYNVNGDALQGELDYEKRLEHAALHEWNVVVIDGRKINVDTLWNTTNAYRNGRYTQGSVYGKFFDGGDILFSQGHRARKTELRDYFGQ